MLNALRYSQHLLKQLVEQFPEGHFIDATVGNGNDLRSILSHPSFKGKAYGFDIQTDALSITYDLLESHSEHLNGHYQLILDSHANIADHFTEDFPLHGAIFNLGYLPGGDHSITTCYDSTITALEQITHRLVKRGQVILVIYSGHPTGKIEKNALLEELSSWPQESFQILQYNFINQRNSPPMTLVIEKR